MSKRLSKRQQREQEELAELEGAARKAGATNDGGSESDSEAGPVQEHAQPGITKTADEQGEAEERDVEEEDPAAKSANLFAAVSAVAACIEHRGLMLYPNPARPGRRPS